ncbi:hypothetical protein QQZ08_005686 [Neonectria magnoliae]|uniref:Uncharacterized protein n=1 Tax=Neonectria magnoliae TaxID=2732573 RepID=A0ABR1I2K8_9HYPO
MAAPPDPSADLDPRDFMAKIMEIDFPDAIVKRAKPKPRGQSACSVPISVHGVQDPVCGDIKTWRTGVFDQQHGDFDSPFKEAHDAVKWALL